MIYGKRIQLRAIEKDDLKDFTIWLNDPEVIKGLLLYAPLSVAEEESWYEDMLKRPNDEHPLIIEVLEGDAWVSLGNCGLHNIDWRCRSAEIGIFIGNKPYWNRGFGTEAMKLMVDYGFMTLNLNRIMLDVYETNLRAIRSYEKAGFVHEGRKRQAMVQDGKYIDVLIMSVLRKDWAAKDA